MLSCRTASKDQSKQNLHCGLSFSSLQLHNIWPSAAEAGPCSTAIKTSFRNLHLEVDLGQLIHMYLESKVSDALKIGNGNLPYATDCHFKTVQSHVFSITWRKFSHFILVYTVQFYTKNKKSLKAAFLIQIIIQRCLSEMRNCQHVCL